MSVGRAFDPFQHIAREEPAPEPDDALAGAPRAWLHGLALMRDRNPRKADKGRWPQIIADAEEIVRRHEWATAAGWSAADLFGFDPVDPLPSLAVAMRGRHLVAITPEFAALHGPSGFSWHYPGLRADVPMLWNFDEREYRL